jgi:hypothetical protein
MVHRRGGPDMSGILSVLRRYRSIVILWMVLLRIVWRGWVLIHVRIVLRGRIKLRILIVPPSPNIRWHSLPCRQMTIVHHAGLGKSAKPTATEVGLEMRVCRMMHE